MSNLPNPNLLKLKQFFDKKFSELSTDKVKALRSSQIFAEFKKICKDDQIEVSWFCNHFYKYKSKLAWQRSGSSASYRVWHAEQIAQKRTKSNSKPLLRLLKNFLGKRFKGLTDAEAIALTNFELLSDFEKKTRSQPDKSWFHWHCSTIRQRTIWKNSGSKKPFYKWRIEQRTNPLAESTPLAEKIRQLFSQTADEVIINLKPKDILKLLQANSLISPDQKKFTSSQTTKVYQALAHERQLAELRIEIKALKSQQGNQNTINEKGDNSVLSLVLKTFEKCNGHIDSTEEEVLTEVKQNLRWLRNASERMKLSP